MDEVNKIWTLKKKDQSADTNTPQKFRNKSLTPHAPQKKTQRSIKVPVTPKLIFSLLKVCYQWNSIAKKFLHLVEKQTF